MQAAPLDGVNLFTWMSALFADHHRLEDNDPLQSCRRSCGPAPSVLAQRKRPRLPPRPYLLAITRKIGSIAAIRYPIAADIDVAHLAAGVNPAVESQVGGLIGVTMLAAIAIVVARVVICIGAPRSGDARHFQAASATTLDIGDAENSHPGRCSRWHSRSGHNHYCSRGSAGRGNFR